MSLVPTTPNIFKFQGVSVLSLFFSHGFKRAFYRNVCAIFTYFLEKITLNDLFLWDSQFWEMADFFQIGIRDISMTFTNIGLGQTLLKLLKWLGPTHKYKRVHDLIVWPFGFLKYAGPPKMHIYLIYTDCWCFAQLAW